jgi:hypothetical protein
MTQHSTSPLEQSVNANAGAVEFRRLQCTGRQLHLLQPLKVLQDVWDGTVDLRKLCVRYRGLLSEGEHTYTVIVH